MRPPSLLSRGALRLGRKVKASARLTTLHLRTLVVYAQNRSRYVAVANPYRVLWIDPRSIEHQIQIEGAQPLIPGTVLEGDWDRKVTSFLMSSKYRGLVDRYDRGLPWEETHLFRTTFAEHLASHGHLMGMRTTTDLVRYYEARIDPLFEDIRLHGFAAPSLLRWIHPVHVLIGREGEFLCGAGGNHRLAIALLLGSERMPVQIEARHSEWQEVRETVKLRGATAVPQSLRGHPDLCDLISTRRFAKGVKQHRNAL